MSNSKITVNVGTYSEPITAEVSVHEIAQKITPEQIGVLLDTYCNGRSTGTSAVNEIAKYLCSTHRTIQASIIRFLMGIVIAYGKVYMAVWKDTTVTLEMATDARNIGAVKVSQLLGKMADETGDLYIPFI